MRSCCLGVIAVLFLANPALANSGSSRAAADAALAAAASGAPTDAAAISLEQHFTTNALDSDLQFSDFYTDLRGSMTHMWTAPSSQGVEQRFDRIACDHMSGLCFVRSHMTAGQDGFRNASS